MAFNFNQLRVKPHRGWEV